jgi:hypothetical protein
VKVRAVGFPLLPPGTLGTVVAIYAKTFGYPYRVKFDGDIEAGNFGRICTRDELEKADE